MLDAAEPSRGLSYVSVVDLAIRKHTKRTSDCSGEQRLQSDSNKRCLFGSMTSYWRRNILNRKLKKMEDEYEKIQSVYKSQPGKKHAKPKEV